MNRPSTAREMVAARNAAVENWRPGAIFDQLAAVQSREGKIFGPPARYALLERSMMRDGAMWWVDEDMCDLVEAAMGSLPEDTELAGVIADDWRALCMFARPIRATDAESGEKQLDVDAFQWGPVDLNDCNGAKGGKGFAISSYQWFEPLGLCPLGRSDWRIEQKLGEVVSPFPGGTQNAYVQSAIEDRRLAAAVWLLASQDGLAVRTTVHSDRATIRRTHRDGIAATDVNVISLRHRPTAHGEPAEHEGSQLRVRVPVTGHWRNQPWGPALALRRPQWIAPHLRGPEDAPLRVRSTVKVLRGDNA